MPSGWEPNTDRKSLGFPLGPGPWLSTPAAPEGRPSLSGPSAQVCESVSLTFASYTTPRKHITASKPDCDCRQSGCIPLAFYGNALVGKDPSRERAPSVECNSTSLSRNHSAKSYSSGLPPCPVPMPSLLIQTAALFGDLEDMVT